MSCNAYKDFSAFNTLFSIGIAAGIIVSYVPQILTIWQRKTTEGISAFFLFLMNASSITMLGNMIILTRPVFGCCSTELSLLQCANSLMGLLQIVAAFLGPCLLLVLALQFVEGRQEIKTLSNTAYGYTVVASITLFLVLTFGQVPAYAHRTAVGLGITGSIFGIIQYFPQLLTTYQLKHTGSLSIVTLLIQIPGGYIWCLSLYLREGSSWSTWAPIFTAASFQVALLVLACYYSVSRSHQIVEVISKPSSRTTSRTASIDETQPLLASSPVSV